MDAERIRRIVLEVMREMERDGQPPQVGGVMRREKAMVLLAGDASDPARSERAREYLNDSRVIFFLPGREGSMPGDTSCGGNTRQGDGGRVIAETDFHRVFHEEKETFTLVYWPLPSVPMMSRMAHLSLDDPSVRILFEALNSTIPVMADFSRLDQLYAHVSPGLRREIRSLAGKIRGFGVHDTAETRPGNILGNNIHGNVHGNTDHKNGFLTLEQVQQMAASGNLQIPSGTKMTPLAADFVREWEYRARRRQD